MRRTEICGVPYDTITLSGVVDGIAAALREGRAYAVCYCNAETVVRAQRDERLRDALGRVDNIFPDGIGLKLFSRWGGARVRERVAGIDVLVAACARVEKLGKSVFLLGGKPGVAAHTADILRKRFPMLRIVGTLDGYEGAHQWRQNAALMGADMVVVATGTPRQELWIDERKAITPGMHVALAVGGAFDMIAGDAPRAPAFLRAWGFEWLWRFFMDPRRWRRIMNAVILFPVQAIACHMKRKKTQ